MTKRRYALRDDQWERIQNLLPGRDGHVGVTAKDNRLSCRTQLGGDLRVDAPLFIEAVLYRYRSGSAWRDLPSRFGDFRAVHTRFSRWSKSGVWERIFEHLATNADNEYKGD